MSFSWNLDLDQSSDISGVDSYLDDIIAVLNEPENNTDNIEPLVYDQPQSQESLLEVNENPYSHYLTPLKSQKRNRKRRGDGEESHKKDPNDNFNYKNKQCYYFVLMVSNKIFRKKCTSKILTSIANAVEILDPMIPRRSRMEKRRKTVCFAWFHRNWEQISKLKPMIIEYLMKS